MQGFYTAQQGHLCLPLPPRDISGGFTCPRINTKNHEHVTLILALGVTSVAPGAILVKECNAASGGTATAIAFDVFKMETTNSDVLGAKVAATAAGFTPVATDNVFYAIEIDARHLSDGYNFLELSGSCESGQSVLAAAVAVLSGSRYAGDQSPTALT